MTPEQEKRIISEIKKTDGGCIIAFLMWGAWGVILYFLRNIEINQETIIQLLNNC